MSRILTNAKEVKIAPLTPLLRIYSPAPSHTDEAEHLLETDTSQDSKAEDSTAANEGRVLAYVQVSEQKLPVLAQNGDSETDFRTPRICY